MRPTFANTLLWQVIAKQDSIFYFTDYSLIDRKEGLTFHKMISKQHLLTPVKDEKGMKSYLNYTDGFEVVTGDANEFKIYAAKFGPFSFQGPPKLVFPLVATKTSSGYSYEFDFTNKSQLFDDYINQLYPRLKSRAR